MGVANMYRPHPISSDSSPLIERRTKEQTLAIFDNILLQMEDGDAHRISSGVALQGGMADFQSHQVHFMSMLW